MSGSVQFISNSFSEYDSPNGRRICLPFPGPSGRAVSSSIKSPLGDCTLISNLKFLSVRCTSRRILTVCNASSSNYRKNSDFSRQNRPGFSRNRNRYNERRDDFEDLEESEALMSKNGPLLAVSGNQKSQTTTAPGPREKEIIELFRKVQAQLRERAAMKEEKKAENPGVKGQGSETVDSLLKLLRKHSVQKGMKNPNDARYRDFILDHQENGGPSTELSSTSIGGSNFQESKRSHLTRPKSSFHRRSPVPATKFRPVYSDGSFNSATHNNLDHRTGISLEPEDKEEPLFSEENALDDDEAPADVFDEMSEDESEGDNGGDEVEDLTQMKLTALRALAKSRGIKGFSKMKKLELINLLMSSSST